MIAETHWRWLTTLQLSLLTSLNVNIVCLWYLSNYLWGTCTI